MWENVPRPILGVHGEDADLEVPGRFVLRATFLSEGLFDERAGGDPEEEDLYEVELTSDAEDLIEPVVFHRLMPASRDAWDELGDEGPAPLPVERFLLALAWELCLADPSNWFRVCEAARRWDSWTVEDALLRLPSNWTPEPLLPDLD